MSAMDESYKESFRARRHEGVWVGSWEWEGTCDVCCRGTCRVSMRRFGWEDGRLEVSASRSFTMNEARLGLSMQEEEA